MGLGCVMGPLGQSFSSRCMVQLSSSSWFQEYLHCDPTPVKGQKARARSSHVAVSAAWLWCPYLVKMIPLAAHYSESSMHGTSINNHSYLLGVVVCAEWSAQAWHVRGASEEVAAAADEDCFMRSCPSLLVLLAAQRCGC